MWLSAVPRSTSSLPINPSLRSHWRRPPLLRRAALSRSQNSDRPTEIGFHQSPPPASVPFCSLKLLISPEWIYPVAKQTENYKLTNFSGPRKGGKEKGERYSEGEKKGERRGEERDGESKREGPAYSLFNFWFVCPRRAPVLFFMGLLQLRYEHDSSTIRLRFERDTTSYEELCAFEQ